jgi:hypothetical protein
MLNEKKVLLHFHIYFMAIKSKSVRGATYVAQMGKCKQTFCYKV